MLKKESTRNEIMGDEFGWWIGGFENSFAARYQSDSCSWSSSASMKSCIDFDESDTCSSRDKLTQSRGGSDDNAEPCSLTHTNHNDVDPEPIEKDADDSSGSIQVDSNYGSDDTDVRAHCYTPERLIRDQDYRIVTPSFTSLLQCMAVANILCSQQRFRLSNETSQEDASYPLLRTFSSGKAENQSENGKKFIETKSLESSICQRSCGGKDSRADEICITCRTENEPALPANYVPDRAVDLCDTNTFNETAKTYVSLGDELSSMLPDQLLTSAPKQNTQFVGGMLTMLDDYSEKVYLLGEDRFCETNSKHNLLTRLALTIETDGTAPQVIDDPDNVVHQLQIKVEKLQHANRDISAEIGSLKDDFCSDMWKVKRLTTMTKKLREDIHEMRYLDDLLNLLQGKLEDVSRRDWPFVLRHSGYETEKTNLIV